jgi:serine/threonine-protein kinase
LYRPNTFQARDGKHHVRIELVDESADLSRLREAVAASSKLDHPNICRVKELVEADGAHVLVMELVDGVSLRDRLLLGECDPVQVVEWLGQLLSALACGHATGLAHGDVSAINVVIDATGTLKLLDFGIGRGPEPATVRADLHAVGVLAQAMFTGDPEQVIEAVPHAYRAWVRTCTSATTPFTDAQGAAAALRDPRVIDARTPAAAIACARSPHREPEPAIAVAPSREPEPAKRRVGAIVAAGVVAVGAIAFWFARSGTPSEPRTTTIAVAPTSPAMPRAEPIYRGRPPLPSSAVDRSRAYPGDAERASLPTPAPAVLARRISPTGATLARIALPRPRGSRTTPCSFSRRPTRTS